MTTEQAIDALFRARWELDGDDHEISVLDDELDALADAAGFDRRAAEARWRAEAQREEAEAHARYLAERPARRPTFVLFLLLDGSDILVNSAMEVDVILAVPPDGVLIRWKDGREFTVRGSVGHVMEALARARAADASVEAIRSIGRAMVAASPPAPTLVGRSVRGLWEDGQ